MDPKRLDEHGEHFVSRRLTAKEKQEIHEFVRAQNRARELKKTQEQANANTHSARPTFTKAE